MGEGKTTPLNITFDELVPGIVSDPGVIAAAGAEVNNLFQAAALRKSLL